MQRQHYAAMDALRGLAAIGVVLFHIDQWLFLPWFVPHAGLAVEFFFCLSGFVVPLAYDYRIRQGLSFRSFAVIRLIRLGPLIVLGTLISALYVLFRIRVQHLAVQTSELPIAVVLGLLCLPYFGASKAMGGPELYPLNGPQYTLFLELAVNAAWASCKILRQPRSSFIIVLISGTLVAIYGIGGDKSEMYWIGFPRVLFSYFLGTLVFYFRDEFKSRAKGPAIFWISLGLTIFLFCYPDSLPWPIEFAWMACCSPLLVFAASRIEISPRTRPPLVWAGSLSYPMYALHYPIFCWINGAFQTVIHHRNPAIEGPLILGGVILASWLFLRFYDEPIRAYLSSVERRTRSASRIETTDQLLEAGESS